MNETVPTQFSSKPPPPAPMPTLGPAKAPLQSGRRISQGKPLALIKRPTQPPSSSSSTSEKLDSDEREHQAKCVKGSKRSNLKSESKPKIKPAVKEIAREGSKMPQLNAPPPKTLAISVSIESTVSEVAKRSRQTVGEQQTGDARIYIEELRRACVGAITGLLGEGFCLRDVSSMRS